MHAREDLAQAPAPAPPDRPSRRRLLGGGVAALSGLFALLGGAREAHAATGDNAKVGQINDGASTTFRSSGLSALLGIALGNVASSNGVFGKSESTTGRGVLGIASATSGSTTGVLGQSMSGAGVGVKGIAPSPTGVGVLGSAPIGVKGVSAAPAGRGVLGAATATSGQALGVYGYSDSTQGVGVLGEARAAATSGQAAGVSGLARGTDGIGVEGFSFATTGLGSGVFGACDSSDGIGVEGACEVGNGIGVYGIGGPTGAGGSFEAPSGQPGALGLKVLGRAEFSTCGVATIASGTNNVVVTPGVEITSNTKVLSTLQSDPASGATVARAIPNAAANTVTIHLTGPAAQTCTVAWFVIG